ncbi:MAG: hypothetical protein M1565_01420 [Actinobacteria bacterium]|nr:hypothetical protein [Actinomycetota bacterium]
MGRYGAIAAAVGFIGLLAWWLHGLGYDVGVLRQLEREEVFGPAPPRLSTMPGLSPSIWLALRFGLPLAAIALAGVALVQTLRGRRARSWFVAVGRARGIPHMDGPPAEIDVAAVLPATCAAK